MVVLVGEMVVITVLVIIETQLTKEDLVAVQTARKFKVLVPYRVYLRIHYISYVATNNSTSYTSVVVLLYIN